jgi:hypothetical protein
MNWDIFYTDDRREIIKKSTIHEKWSLNREWWNKDQWISDFNIWENDVAWWQTLTQIIAVCNAHIYKHSLKMGANYIECNLMMKPIIELLSGFQINNRKNKYRYGILDGRYTVGFNYKMPYNKILVAGINEQGIMCEDTAIITVKGL